MAGAGLLFHELTTPYATVAAGPPSNAALASGKHKLAAVSAASKQAVRVKQPWMRAAPTHAKRVSQLERGPALAAVGPAVAHGGARIDAPPRSGSTQGSQPE